VLIRWRFSTEKMKPKRIFKVTRNPDDYDELRDVNYVKENFASVINVSDTECLTFKYMESGIPSYWFPIHETWHWGYGPFYATAKIHDQNTTGKPILIHCHAGANRSVTVAYCVLKSLGRTDEECNREIGRDAKFQYDMNIYKGYIPHDVIDFLYGRYEKPTYSIGGLLQNIGSPNIFLKKKEITITK